MFCRMTMLNIFAFTAKAAAYHHEEDRYEENSQYGCRYHPAQYASTYRILRAGTRAGTDNQRHNPSMNANEVIRIGRKRIRTASSVASTRPFPSLSIKSLANSTISIAFFADNPMVVSRPTEVNVVSQSAEGRSQQRADNPKRNNQHYGERDRPALIQCRQTQEDDDQRDSIQGRGTVAGQPLW